MQSDTPQNIYRSGMNEWQQAIVEVEFSHKAATPHHTGNYE